MRAKQRELKAQLAEKDTTVTAASADKAWRDAAQVTGKKVRADAEHVKFLAENVHEFGRLGEQLYNTSKRNFVLSSVEEDESRAFKKRRKALK